MASEAMSQKAFTAATGCMYEPALVLREEKSDILQAYLGDVLVRELVTELMLPQARPSIAWNQFPSRPYPYLSLGMLAATSWLTTASLAQSAWIHQIVSTDKLNMDLGKSVGHPLRSSRERIYTKNL